MKRYHPFLVTLHWLMAALIIATLLSGGIAPLNFHLTTGALIAGLLLLRVISRQTNQNALPPTGRDTFQTRLARWMHLALYVLIAAVVASGLGLAVEANLYQVLQGNEQLPVNFKASTLFVAHRIFTTLLQIAVATHVLAAFWHQLIRRDRLFSRMWFAKSNPY